MTKSQGRDALEDSSHETGLWPFGHFFIPIADRPHKEHSALVANAFCSAYQRQFAGFAGVLDVEVENEIDAIVEIDGTEIVLEFVRYYRRDEFHDVERADAAVREMLSRALGDADVGRFQVWVWWKEEQRRKCEKGQSSTVGKIPRSRRDQEAFVEEFVRLASRVAQDPDLANKYIHFAEDGRLRRYRRGRNAALPKSEFRILADWLRRVRLEPWDREFDPQIITNADVRWVELDREQLTGIVQKKLEKLHDHYRKRAGGRPIWLLVHSDGHPSPSRIAPHQRSQVVDVIGKILRESNVSFDAVWWGEDMTGETTAELFRVT